MGIKPGLPTMRRTL